MNNVIKRCGLEVEFDPFKIERAIESANDSIEVKSKRISKRLIKLITDEIVEIYSQNKRVRTVEYVQDLIEQKLIEYNAFEVARTYIKYRYKRELARGFGNDFFDAITEKLTAKNVQNQNANVDEKSFGGRMGEANSVMTKKYALDNLVSTTTRENHENNRIYQHDLDSYAVGMHNCLSVPFDKLLEDGFDTRQTDVRPAGSVNTACQLIAVIFQLQSLQQFGGVSATHIDWTMVPYVRKSFYKHYKDGCKYIARCEPSDNCDEYTPIDSDKYTKQSMRVYNYAMDMTQKEIHQAVEALYHNLNTLQSRSGNQLPFTSINYGTCVLQEGRMFTKALLEVLLEGLGSIHRTSVFPCGIFQYMKGVNDKPGTPNYDLYRIALTCTSKRLYPNYANVDWSGNVGYDRTDPKTYFSTMGALAGKEHLYVKINGGTPQDVTIKELYEYCKYGENLKGRPSQIVYTKDSLNLPGKTRKAQDHSQSTCKKEPGVYRITYLPQDVSYIGSSSNIQQRWREHKVAIRTTGGPDCGIKFNDPHVSNYLFEVIEYTEDYKNCESKYIMKEPNINIRGISNKYYKQLSRKGEPLYKKPSFRYDLSVEQDLIDLSDKNIMVLDRDNQWTKIRHIFKNDKLNTPQMMHIQYKECDRTCTLSCTEDHPLWNGITFVRASNIEPGDVIYRADNIPLIVTSVSWHWEAIDSYDIGTETGTFIGSDIIMHNCRTANGADINAEPGTNPQTKDGRGNICPCTIIMPTLAMEAKESYITEYDDDIIEVFMEFLDKAIDDAKDSLIERFEYICAQSSASARFMYENGTMLGYKPEEGIRSALKHGTLAIGQLGLAETLEILIGKNHTTEEGMVLAKRIEQLFKDKCSKFKQEYKLNFGVYYTPAENLCKTAMIKFKEKYGIIPRVSDKDYFTNSIHVPVYEKVDAFQKIDIESQLTGYSSAGCITYVELDGACVHNIDALEKIVNYAMAKDIPYFAINVPNDTCLDCGFTGEFNDKCPQCGSTNIQQLRRVTGYLTGNYKTAFNSGKVAETEDRVKHTGVEVE